MSDSRDIGHRIATKAAQQIVKEGIAAGLDWKDLAVSCESAVAIVIAAVVELNPKPDPVRYATELVELLTERAHGRVTALILGLPYAG